MDIVQIPVNVVRSQHVTAFSKNVQVRMQIPNYTTETLVLYLTVQAKQCHVSVMITPC
jgi:hypothetical protein